MAIAYKPVYGFNNAKDKVEVPAMNTGKMMIQKKVYNVQSEGNLPANASTFLIREVGIDKDYEGNPYNRPISKSTAIVSVLGVSGNFIIKNTTIEFTDGESDLSYFDCIIKFEIENVSGGELPKPSVKFSVAWFN